MDDATRFLAAASGLPAQISDAFRFGGAPPPSRPTIVEEITPPPQPAQPVATVKPAPDPATRPPGGAGCIDITERMTFCRGSAVERICRAGEIGDEIEDLRAARWYLDREIARLEAGRVE